MRAEASPCARGASRVTVVRIGARASTIWSDVMPSATGTGLPLRDLVEELELRFAAGESAAAQPVRWVHISELEDPTPWLSGGELLLTTGMQLTDPERQRAYVARLVEHRLAGLGLGTGFAHQRVPEALIAAAEEHGFPLFEVPYEVPFIALTEKAFAHLVNEQYAVLRRALALPVARAGGADAQNAETVPQAWLVAAKDSGPLTEFDRLTLHQAVTIVALELLRRRMADDTERRLAGDVLSALVSGELAGAELARRLEPFGVRDRAGMLVLAPPRPVKAAVEDALVRAVRDEVSFGLVAGTGRFSCALLAPPRGADDEELFVVAERLRMRVGREVGADLAAGAGRPVPPGDARRTFHEARCALETRTLAGPVNGGGAGPVATYRDLGSFQLLLSLQDDEALRLFCDSILAPIEEGEGAYGGELMRSLEAFIECNGQGERAARRPYFHRHTLRYRIRRVEELTGRSLDSARDRIDFWLALRGRELTKGTA